MIHLVAVVCILATLGRIVQSEPCPAGYSRTCELCPENTYSTKGSDCIPCPLATYNIGKGNLDCTECPSFTPPHIPSDYPPYCSYYANF